MGSRFEEEKEQTRSGFDGRPGAEKSENGVRAFPYLRGCGHCSLTLHDGKGQ